MDFGEVFEKKMPKAIEYASHIIMETSNFIDFAVALVDYMDEDFIEQEKNRDYNNFICGRYEVGRFAWILKNIEILDEPIEIKGQLGLWNYNDFEKSPNNNRDFY